ncbi:MAG: 3-hydroxyacyl-ACP dehydratase FabZ [Candidatus Omnitrophica bacterium]|nr:3-hydroxyacyl-ACP dehydratase FabZ [Candidatus Omnitrophota bacterium]
MSDKGKVMDIQEIMSFIPHRYPFLLIDRVIDYEKMKWVKAYKNVSFNEPYFQGHFPGKPIMPGVLIVEALAQTGGVLAMISGEGGDKMAFFMTIDNAKFKAPVVPGDRLDLKAELVKIIRGNILKLHGEATVNDKVVCKADIMFAIMDRKDAII